MWPKWMLPLAYGRAEVTRILRWVMVGVLPFGLIIIRMGGL